MKKICLLFLCIISSLHAMIPDSYEEIEQAEPESQKSKEAYSDSYTRSLWRYLTKHGNVQDVKQIIVQKMFNEYDNELNFIEKWALQTYYTKKIHVPEYETCTILKHPQKELLIAVAGDPHTATLYIINTTKGIITHRKLLLHNPIKRSYNYHIKPTLSSCGTYVSLSRSNYPDIYINTQSGNMLAEQPKNLTFAEGQRFEDHHQYSILIESKNKARAFTHAIKKSNLNCAAIFCRLFESWRRGDFCNYIEEIAIQKNTHQKFWPIFKLKEKDLISLSYKTPKLTECRTPLYNSISKIREEESDDTIDTSW